MIHSKERAYILDQVKQLDGFEYAIWRTRFRQDFNSDDRWEYPDGTLCDFVDFLISQNENVKG